MSWRASPAERELQEAIIEEATVRRWLVYHTFDSRRSAAGFPDLVLVRNGRLLFVELKTEKGELSVEQLVWQRALELVVEELAAVAEVAGMERRVGYAVWRPADWSSGVVSAELAAR